MESDFHWASALCTAGFQFAELEAMSPTARLLLIGGMAGSTAGGLKLYRIAILAEGAADRIGRLARQPWRLSEHESLGSDEEAIRRRRALEAASILALLWIALLVAGTLVLLHAAGRRTPADAVLLEAASALGNVGLSVGITGPDLPWHGRATLIMMMWLGRLEIVPALVLLASLRRGSRNKGH